MTHVIHYCYDKHGMDGLANIGWIWDERPLNKEAHPLECPYCGWETNEMQEATPEMIDVLNLHNVGQQVIKN